MGVLEVLSDPSYDPIEDLRRSYEGSGAALEASISFSMAAICFTVLPMLYSLYSIGCDVPYFRLIDDLLISWKLSNKASTKAGF